MTIDMLKTLAWAVPLVAFGLLMLWYVCAKEDET